MIHPKALNCITMTVRDLDRSIRWYGEKLGFERLYDDAPNSKGVVVGNDTIQLCLQAIDPSTPTVDHVNSVCVRTFGFQVDEEDLARVEQEFPQDSDIIVLDDHPRYRTRIVEDPDGHVFELHCERPV